MKDRIKQIMDHEGLNDAQFAKAIGINRSAMSHYTTGRNKPGVDVINKIHDRYPHFKLEWLINGKGDMLIREPAPIITNVTEGKNGQLDMFAAPPAPAVEKLNPPVKTVIVSQQQPQPEYRQETKVQPPRSTYKQPAYEHSAQQKKETKNVTKIMLFYSDDTFETFIPEKNRRDKG
jgi:transcriptional regulator with XRE-family HTH domain